LGKFFCLSNEISAARRPLRLLHPTDAMKKWDHSTVDAAFGAKITAALAFLEQLAYLFLQVRKRMRKCFLEFAFKKMACCVHKFSTDKADASVPKCFSLREERLARCDSKRR